jgi:hypothetical protein
MPVLSAGPSLHQRLAIELAALGLRQFIAQHNVLRRLERRQRCGAMAQDIAAPIAAPGRSTT